MLTRQINIAILEAGRRQHKATGSWWGWHPFYHAWYGIIISLRTTWEAIKQTQLAVGFNKPLPNKQAGCGTPYHSTHQRMEVCRDTGKQYVSGMKKIIQIYRKLAPHLLQELSEVQVAGIVFWSRTPCISQCSFSKSLWCEITKCPWPVPSTNPSRLY